MMIFRKCLWSFALALPLCFVTLGYAMDVTLGWNANTESDLAGYKIYYKTGSSGEPYNGTGADQGPSPITVPIGAMGDPNNPTYTLTGLGNNEVYFFAVTAYDDGGLESDYSTDVNVLSIDLPQGSNLISLCRRPVDTGIASVLSSISGKYSSVWVFIDNSWKVYDPANPGFSDLTTMEAGMGYWIDMSESATLVISGSAPLNSVDLVSGWNLVGYNSASSLAIADALASIDGIYLSVWAFIDGSWKVYDPANPGFSDLTAMEPGYGYWIDASEACTWALP